MFSKPNQKVQFQDQQLDDYVLENSVLKSKLQSKLDALSIMSKELDKCSMERDRYKLLVEQLKCKKSVPKYDDIRSNTYKFTLTNTISNGDILAKTRDDNNLLKLEVETLQSKLEDAIGDIEALRKQLQKKDISFEENAGVQKCNIICSNSEYEQLVQELEKNKKKYQQLLLDYRATLDEKEELVSDRDYYKNKVQRLNQQISYILSNRTKSQSTEDDGDPPKPIVDIDALMTETKYLHERIRQMQVEKVIIKRTLNKYKTLLDNRNKNYNMNIKGSFNDVMTQTQAREFLERSLKSESKQTSAAELKSLCLGLFEAMNDKSIALQHQRKTNQILANRIAELEKTLESWCNGHKYLPISASQLISDIEYPEEESKSETLNGNHKKEYRNTLSEIEEEFNQIRHDTSDSPKDDNESSRFRFAETKTVLPDDLQELVNEALAEINSEETDLPVRFDEHSGSNISLNQQDTDERHNKMVSDDVVEDGKPAIPRRKLPLKDNYRNTPLGAWRQIFYL